MSLLSKINENSNLSTYLNDDIEQQVELIGLTNLKIVENQEFKSYRNSERYSQLKESIKKLGIITPLLVRPISNKMYEILSGRHRFYVANDLQMSTVPCVVLKNVSNDEAHLILIDSNLCQRDKLLISEKAKAWKNKKEILSRRKKEDKYDEDVGISARKMLAEEFNTSEATIKRLIRLTYLNDGLLDLVDLNKLSIHIAYELSFISPEKQDLILEYIEHNPKIKLNKHMAEELKKNYESLTKEMIDNIVNEKESKAKNKRNEQKIKNAIKDLELDSYFVDKNEHEVIEILKKAMNMYLNR